MKSNVYKTLIKNQALVSDFNAHWTAEPYLLGTRNQFNIIDLRATVQSIIITAKAIKHTLEVGKHILIINTDNYNAPIIKSFKSTCNSDQFSVVNTKWFGGTLTNWVGLSKKVTRFKRFTQFIDFLATERQIPLVALENLKKSYDEFNVDNNKLPVSSKITPQLDAITDGTKMLNARNYKRQFKNRGALSSNTLRMNKVTPENQRSIRVQKLLSNASTEAGMLSNLNLGLVLVLNANANQHAIREAFKLNIPVAAIVESNTDRQNIAYPILGNPHSPKFIQFFFNFVAKVIRQGSSK